MNLFLPLGLVFCLTAISGYAQQNDSTDKYEYKPNEMVTISNEWYSQFNSDTFRTTNAAYRSSLLIHDPVLRHCYVTAKLIEYKKGNKIREKLLLVKDKVYKDPRFASFEDSSFVFSLYRSASVDNKNRFKWVFRTPSNSNVEEISLTNAEDYNTVFIEDIIQTKIPIGKPFVFLVVTAPDKTRNFPFYRKENKGKYSAYEWSKFKLDHTFLIELTVEKSMEPNKKKENSTVL